MLGPPPLFGAVMRRLAFAFGDSYGFGDSGGCVIPSVSPAAPAGARDSLRPLQRAGGDVDSGRLQVGGDLI